jgi:YHS domain-containing protein
MIPPSGRVDAIAFCACPPSRGLRAAIQERKAEQGIAHIDPVCGMVVDDKDAPNLVYKGTTYCARADKDQFDTNPQQYAK